MNADEKDEEPFVQYWRGRSGQRLPVGRKGVILKINKSKFCMICKWILTYGAIYLWRQAVIYSVILCVTAVYVSQTLQRTVAGVACKTNWKTFEKKKRSWPKWRHHFDIRLDTPSKIMIKFSIAFPAEILPGHVQGTGHKHRPLLNSEQLLTLSFTRTLLHAGICLLTVGTWFSLKQALLSPSK